MPLPARPWLLYGAAFTVRKGDDPPVTTILATGYRTPAGALAACTAHAGKELAWQHNIDDDGNVSAAATVTDGTTHTSYVIAWLGPPVSEQAPAREKKKVPQTPAWEPPVGERRTRQAIPQDIKVAVAARDQGRCQCTAYPCHGYPGLCGSTLEPQFDHVIPWSDGGADTVANLIVKCGPCNRRKGARYTE